MATRAELIDSLRQAHAAGDTEAAQRLADAVRAMPEESATPNVDALKEQFKAMSPGQKAATFANDQFRLLASGLTFGGADNLIGAINGNGADAEKAKTAESRARAGGSGLITELGGGFGPAGLVSKAVGGLTKLRGLTMGETAAREGIAGVATGGASAAFDGKDAEDIAGQAGLTGILSGTLGAGGVKAADWVSKVANKVGIGKGILADDVKPPRTRAQMRTDTKDAYDTVDRMGIRYDPSDYTAMANRLDAALQTARINPNLHPRATEMATTLRTRPVGPVTPRSMDELRRQVSRDVTGDQGESAMASIMREHIDDFIETGKTTTGRGTAKQASDALLRARDMSRRSHILDEVTEAAERGENSANGMGDVAYLRTLLNNPKRRRGMTDEELDAMRRVVRGDTVENALRAGGNMGMFTPLGTTIGVTGLTGGNYLAGILAGGTVAATKPVLRAGARRYTDRNMEDLLSTIAGGGRVPSELKKLAGPLGLAEATKEVDEDRDSIDRRRRRKPAY